MKIVDAVIFNNELDIIGIRLEEMSPAVDWFVLVEGNRDFKGDPKPMEYDLHRDRFAKFAHKIIHVKVEDYPENVDAWAREAWTRNATLRGVKQVPDLDPEDWVILSDVDEIIRQERLWNIREVEPFKIYDPKSDVIKFNLSFRYYKFNCRAVNDGWGAPIAVRARLFTDPQNTRHNNNPEIPWDHCFTVPNAGWHFSYMGGVDAIIRKIEQNAHQELNTPEWKDRAHIEKALKMGMDLYKRQDQRWEFIDDKDYPQFVLDNPEKFEPFFEPIPKARFRVVIPFTGNRALLDKAIESVRSELRKHSEVTVSSIVIIDNVRGGSVINTDREDHEVLWEHLPTEPMLLPQVLNWAIQRAEKNFDDFMFWMHDDAELRPGALKIMLDKRNELEARGVKWGAIFSTGAGDVASFYNPKYNFQTNSWYEPLLFPMYFMDCHYFRCMAAKGWELHQSHNEGDMVIVDHVGSHTIKEDAAMRAKNDFLQRPWSELYERIWGGRPGSETILDAVTAGTLPKELS